MNQCRIVGLSASLANAKDVGDWIGATAHSLVSFRPDVRPVPLELRLQGFDVNHFGSRMLAMAKPAYNYVAASCAGEWEFLDILGVFLLMFEQKRGVYQPREYVYT